MLTKDELLEMASTFEVFSGPEPDIMAVFVERRHQPDGKPDRWVIRSSSGNSVFDAANKAWATRRASKKK